MTLRRLLISILAVGLTLAALTMPSGALASAPVETTASDPLTPEEQDLLDSQEPVNIVMDAETGQPLSVEEPPETGALRVVAGACYGPPRRPCYRTGNISNNVQFASEPGETTGSWANRTGWSSGATYEARACWNPGTGRVCSGVWIPPSSDVTFNNAVRGTVFRQR